MVGVALAGDDYDFENFARSTGCESVIFSDRRSQCSSLQSAVNKFCKETPFECSLTDFNKTLGEYNSAKGQMANTDDEKKAKLEKTKRLWKELDSFKKKAIYGEPIAAECVRNRNSIMEHFSETIRKTESAGKAQLDVRKALIDKLRESEKRRDEAKAKRDSTPNDDSLKRAYDEAVEAFRKVEQELGEFNKKNGQDIEKNYLRLNEGYRYGNEKHKEERDNQSNRWNNCIGINRTDIGYEPS
ncbi:MAG: hypothetical protein ABI867_24055 [Kofleriaceae bacterium]